MEFEKIKQLMDEMGNSKLTSLKIEFPDGTKIKMEKGETVKVAEVATVTAVQSATAVTTPVIQEAPAEDGKIVKSTMVGTFYSKPSPNSEPYVEVGKRVKKGDVLCIIEAMKLMNEIESEFDGEIKEILVKDGEMVEYGKPLFKII